MAVKLLRISVLADDYAGYEVQGLYAQHGLSLLLEVLLDSGVTKRILFDVGQDGVAVIHNAELMGLDIGDIDMIVLSHSHYDHSGGLLEILKHVKKKPIPLIAHPDIVKPAIHLSQRGLRDVGLPYTLNQAEEAGARPILVSEPMEVAPGVVFLGEIPRYRKDLASEIKDLYTVENGRLVPHTISDDTGIAINVEGYGVILVSGCSHSGIANMVIHTSKLLSKPVRAVFGGLHLVGADREKIRKVIEVLRSEGVEEVYVGHCTGLEAEYMLLEAYGENFTKIHTGFTKTFGT